MGAVGSLHGDAGGQAAGARAPADVVAAPMRDANGIAYGFARGWPRARDASCRVVWDFAHASLALTRAAASDGRRQPLLEVEIYVACGYQGRYASTMKRPGAVAATSATLFLLVGCAGDASGAKELSSDCEQFAFQMTAIQEHVDNAIAVRNSERERNLELGGAIKTAEVIGGFSTHEKLQPLLDDVSTNAAAFFSDFRTYFMNGGEQPDDAKFLAAVAAVEDICTSGG